MRKFLVTAVFGVALLGMLSPPVFAQAPAPKVTITGAFDQVTSAGRNFYDGNYARTSDHEWYARVRFRPDFVFEVGRTKAVMGLEIDVQYGAVSPAGGGPGKGGSSIVNGLNTTTLNGTTVNGGAGSSLKPGATADAGLNTDVTGIVEFKWLYTEFDLTGKDSLLPFIPVPTVSRAGLQPFASLATYKLAGYAQGDFAGLSAVTTFAPNLKTNLAYVMIDDETATSNRGAGQTAGSKLTRGNDFAVIVSPEYTPFKGLDIKPLYSYFHGEGTVSGSARRGAADRFVGGSFSNAIMNGTTLAPGAVNFSGVNTASGVTWGGANVGSTGAIAAGTSAYLNGQPNQHEERHTIGIDASWRMGPWGLDPTLYYQWGTRNVQAAIDHPGSGFTVGIQETKASAWFFDTIGSYQAGPFLLEVRGIYSPGNKARDNLSKQIRYYEVLDADTNVWGGWGQILALGLDYFNGNGSSNAGMATNVGYDRYGRAQFGIRGTYNMTPALSFYTIVTPTWTAEKVDTDTGVAGVTPGATLAGRTIVSDRSLVEGDSRYIGTEWDLGFNWKFAPNTTFSLVGGWLFAGSALDNTECVTTGSAGGSAIVGTCTGGTLVKKKAEDAWTIASRITLSF